MGIMPCSHTCIVLRCTVLYCTVLYYTAHEYLSPEVYGLNVLSLCPRSQVSKFYKAGSATLRTGPSVGPDWGRAKKSRLAPLRRIDIDRLSERIRRGERQPDSP